MVQHILKIVWKQRRSNVLIWVELLIVSVLLWMVMDQLCGIFSRYTQPKGYNTENTYFIQIEKLPGQKCSDEADADSLQKAFEEPFYSILERARRCPEVENASASRFSRPYSRGRSCREVQVDGKTGSFYKRSVSADFFKVFQIPIICGRSLKEGFGNEIVISKSVADSLYGGAQNAIGKTCTIKEDKYQIVGVTSSYKYYNFGEETGTFYIQFAPEFRNKLSSMSDLEICIRLKSNASASTVEHMKKELQASLRESPYYIKRITSFDDLQKQYYKFTGITKEMKMSISIILFFLVNVLVGIVGTFWFRTEQRKNEIGLRLAIGSTGKSIRRYFIAESSLLVLLASLPAAWIVFHLRYFEIQLFASWNANWGVFAAAGLATFLILLGLVALGTWIPIRNASKVVPSEALHYE